ncbi:MAG: HlyD family secretion protein [Gammaproteobacteria bacterium]
MTNIEQSPTDDNISSTESSVEKPNNHKRNTMIWVVIGIILCMGVYGYFLYQKYWPYTDDAYVNAHYIYEAAQVSGPVSEIFVHNNQFVRKNQIIFEIAPQPFQAIVDQQTANLKLAVQQMEADIAAVNVAAANVNEVKAQLIVNQKNYDRTVALVQKGQASISSGDDALGQLQGSQAQLIAAQNQLIQAQKTLGDVGSRNAQIQLARAELKSARLNLSYTRIYAPADGFITNFDDVRIGTMITAQQTVFQLVESNKWWVYANYKETQMERMKPGQPATISIDMYPGVRFKGYIDSISSGSGAIFSLLPPENATGNWVKVTQRFPVKVVITDVDPRYPLRAGASSEVTISTLKKYK